MAPRISINFVPLSWGESRLALPQENPRHIERNVAGSHHSDVSKIVALHARKRRVRRMSVRVAIVPLHKVERCVYML